ncbi:PREDICTED: double-stranded RNA-specific editase B2 [Ceratotherium simum simum]|uniref:Double-stranded RNA-specific editase B2 n=1 Tax=Ceratotherium simum simum TaxID=73337 RepID=A0ABM1CHJ2_CERSS|nr:PREDICTED: double-stranded RNA-specific editase B2 [Ceratotherium simum simum]
MATHPTLNVHAQPGVVYTHSKDGLTKHFSRKPLRGGKPGQREDLGSVALQLGAAQKASGLQEGVSNAEARQQGKSPHFSLNWVVGNADMEIIDATTGKRSCGSSSRLCKHMFSARWARLYGKLSTRIPSHGDTPSMYCEAKLGACTYQAVKQQLFRAFQKAGLGTWVRKPPEQDQFLLTL